MHVHRRWNVYAQGTHPDTWEAADDILDPMLVSNWKAECALRKAEAWEMDERTLMEEPVLNGASEEAVRAVVQKVAEGLGNISAEKAEVLQQELLRAAKVCISVHHNYGRTPWALTVICHGFRGMRESARMAAVNPVRVSCMANAVCVWEAAML